MDAEEFVKVIVQVVHDAAVSTTMAQLENDVGRKLPSRLRVMSEWFNGLPVSDQDAVREVAEHAARTAVFGLFCVLDGVRAIENGPDKGTLELVYRKGTKSTLLNDQKGEMLHDLFAAEMPLA